MSAIIKGGDVFFLTVNDRVNTPGLIPDQWVVLSQLRHIKPILTEDLYNAYIATPTDYTDLDDYLKPCLANFCLLDNIDKLHIQLTDNGLYKVSQGNSTQNATEEERNVFKSTLKHDGNKYAEFLTEYLDENYEDNTLYVKSDNIYNRYTFAGGLLWPKTTTTTTKEGES